MSSEARNIFGLVPVGTTEKNLTATNYRLKIRQLVAEAQQFGFDRPAQVREELSQGVQYELLGPNTPLPSPAGFPMVKSSRLQVLGFLNVIKHPMDSIQRDLIVYGDNQNKETDLEISYVSTSGGTDFTVIIGEDVTASGITLADAYNEVLRPLLEGRQRFTVFPPLGPTDRDNIRLGGQRDLRYYERNGKRKPEEGSFKPLPYSG